MIGFLRIGRHDRLRTLLSSYIDGQITSAEAARVEEHLAGCQECQAGLEDLRATVGLLKALPELEIPRSFTLDAVPEPVPAPWRFGWATGMAATAAAVLLIALLAGDLTGLLRQPGQVVVVKGAAAVEAPVEAVPAAAAAAAMAAPAAAPRAPGEAPAPAPTVEAAAIQAVEAEVAVVLEKEAAPAAAAMAAPVERVVVVESEKEEAPVAAAMAAPVAESEAPASTVDDNATLRTVERKSAVDEETEEAPKAEAPALAAGAPSDLAPEATPRPQASPSLTDVAPRVASQADAGTEAVAVPAETKDEAAAVSKQVEALAPDAAAADGEDAVLQAPATQEGAEPADRAVSLPLRELELATGALLALLVLVLLSFAVRRRRAI